MARGRHVGVHATVGAEGAATALHGLVDRDVGDVELVQVEGLVGLERKGMRGEGGGRWGGSAGGRGGGKRKRITGGERRGEVGEGGGGQAGVGRRRDGTPADECRLRIHI